MSAEAVRVTRWVQMKNALDKRVLSMLAERANENHDASASITELMAGTNASHTAIENALARLTVDRWITRGRDTGERGAANEH